MKRDVLNNAILEKTVLSNNDRVIYAIGSFCERLSYKATVEGIGALRSATKHFVAAAEGLTPDIRYIEDMTAAKMLISLIKKTVGEIDVCGNGELLDACSRMIKQLENLKS